MHIETIKSLFVAWRAHSWRLVFNCQNIAISSFTTHDSSHKNIWVRFPSEYLHCQTTSQSFICDPCLLPHKYLVHFTLVYSLAIIIKTVRNTSFVIHGSCPKNVRVQFPLVLLKFQLSSSRSDVTWQEVARSNTVNRVRILEVGSWMAQKYLG